MIKTKIVESNKHVTVLNTNATGRAGHGTVNEE